MKRRMKHAPPINWKDSIITRIRSLSNRLIFTRVYWAKIIQFDKRSITVADKGIYPTAVALPDSYSISNQYTISHPVQRYGGEVGGRNQRVAHRVADREDLQGKSIIGATLRLPYARIDRLPTVSYRPLPLTVARCRCETISVATNHDSGPSTSLTKY